MTEERIFRILIIVLLVAILWLQLPKEEQISSLCSAALEEAQRYFVDHGAEYRRIDETYSEVVYDKAENINQQIFLSGELRFDLLRYMALDQLTITKILAHCK